MLRRPRDRADDFRVAHFEIGAPVRGGARGDVGGTAAEFVPAAAVEAEEGEGVGCGVEGHDFFGGGGDSLVFGGGGVLGREWGGG